MRNELDIQTLQRAKANAVAYYHAQDTDQDFWEQCIQDIDDEIKDIDRQLNEPIFTKARIVAMAVVALILVLIALSGCETMSGFGKDVTWVSDRTQEALKKD